MFTRHEALRLLADEVVGVCDPAQVHDDERLRWGDIREALTTEPPLQTQRKCWQAGMNHLCNKKCENEGTQDDIDTLVSEYRAEQVRELDRQKELIRRTQAFIQASARKGGKEITFKDLTRE